jgi:hypothetical protein
MARATGMPFSLTAALSRALVGARFAAGYEVWPLVV